MNKITILTILLLFTLSVGKCSEFSSWWQKTLYGNEICEEKWNNEYVIGIKSKNKKENQYGHIVTNLKRWYFYKNHIIGQLTEKDEQKYFIFNELNSDFFLFSSHREFKKKINELNLNPKLWSRWYSSNWGIIVSSRDFGDSLDFIFVTLPILILTLLIIIAGMVWTKFNLKHIFNKISLVILALIIGRILLDVLPQSI